MNETSRGHLSIVGLLALAACADARGGRLSSPAPQTVTVATARDGGATSPELAAPRVARALGERAALAFQAVNDARWADARALLDGYDDDMSCSDGSVQVRPLEGGGEMVIAARGLARSDATGKVVSHEVFTEACVRYADPELTVLLRKDGVLVRTKDLSHAPSRLGRADERPRRERLRPRRVGARPRSRRGLARGPPPRFRASPRRNGGR